MPCRTDALVASVHECLIRSIVESTTELPSALEAKVKVINLEVHTDTTLKLRKDIAIVVLSCVREIEGLLGNFTSYIIAFSILYNITLIILYFLSYLSVVECATVVSWVVSRTLWVVVLSVNTCILVNVCFVE